VLHPQPRRRIRAPLCLAAALAFSLAALSAAAAAAAADLRAAADAPRAPAAAQSPNAAEPARRVVSLYPSLTAILLAIGAADALVGVDAFSAQQQSLTGVAQVGGLYNPSVERVLALRPDLVVAVPSVAQRGFLERLRDLNAPLLELNPVSFEDVAVSVETLGRRVGRSGAAGARANALRRARRRAEALTRGRPPVPMLFVVERDPVFVAGPGSFLDDMLRAAGARNLAASFKTPWPRVSREWLIAAAPELLLDSSPDPQPAARWWARWPSLPAVQRGRVVQLRSGEVTLPGPWLDRALLRIFEIVQGPELAAALAAELPAAAQSPERAGRAEPRR